MTYQIIYSSLSSTPMQQEELEDLLEQAQGNNATRGITGALVYVDGYFLQVLEGGEDDVQELMARIARDLRHETVSVLQAGDVPAASFANWTMAYVSATPEQVAAWAGLSGTTQLPQLFEDMRRDRQKAEQVAKSILAVVAGAPALPASAG